MLFEQSFLFTYFLSGVEKAVILIGDVACLKKGKPIGESSILMNSLALVTGASAGIGLNIAKELAARGYDIIAVGSSERVQKVQEQLEGVTVYAVQADLTTGEGLDKIWTEFEGLNRHLDAAVLNAGKSLGGAFHDTDLEDELYMLQLNVISQVKLAKKLCTVWAGNEADEF